MTVSQLYIKSLVLMMLAASFVTAQLPSSDGKIGSSGNFIPIDCLKENVVLLPDVNLLISGVHEAVATPAACQSLCAQRIDCIYFTYIHSLQQCILKPGIGYDAALTMVVGKCPSSGGCVSGSKRCDIDLEELTPLINGCGASSPALCSQLKAGLTAFYDGSCATSRTDDCGVAGYECCKSCKDIESDCCKGYASGRVFHGGENLSSKWFGIFSAEHCHSLCIATAECTHWSYIRSSATGYIGGACYLKKGGPNEVRVPATILSSVGRDKCRVISCLEKGRPRSNNLAVRHEFSGGAVACQTLCKKTAGCSGFDFYSYQRCDLLFGTPVTLDSEEEVTQGPVSCSGVEGATSDCILVGKMFRGVLSYKAYMVTAEVCSTAASDNAGWSFVVGGKCGGEDITPCCHVFKSIIEGATDDVPNTLSGKSKCKWLGNGNRRMLSDNLLGTDVLPVGTECLLYDQVFVGGFIEMFEKIEGIEMCLGLCQSRADCKQVSFNFQQKVCSLHWGGTLEQKPAVVSFTRSCAAKCADGVCPEVTGEPMTQGLIQVSLGGVGNWTVKGTMMQFSNPRAWTRLALLILADEEGECFISDVVNSERTCWHQRQGVFPIHIKIQVVGVAKGVRFQGWSNLSWNKVTADDSAISGHFELMNDDVIIEESDKPLSDHGVFIKEVNSEATLNWPENLLAPMDFAEGVFYARFHVISTPVARILRTMICLTGSDDPASEICSPVVVLPPFNV